MKFPTAEPNGSFERPNDHSRRPYSGSLYSRDEFLSEKLYTLRVIFRSRVCEEEETNIPAAGRLFSRMTIPVDCGPFPLWYIIDSYRQSLSRSKIPLFFYELTTDMLLLFM